MNTTTTMLACLAALVLAPILGGLIAGLDRKLTARLQGRYGPPILQPFYDVAKLMAKRPSTVNPLQAFSAYGYLAASALSVLLFFMRADLLLIFFVLTVGAILLVMGGMASPSPYSQIGAQRELIQMLTYEPLLIMVFAAIFLTTGSFRIDAILDRSAPLLPTLPLVFFVLLYALTIKLRKSPFDFSTSHHGHQEIVKGVLNEYSGPYLAMIEIAHWYEVVLVLGFCALFWATSWIGVAVLLFVAYFLEVLLDNVCARLTWRWMVKYVWAAGTLLTVVNLAALRLVAR